MKLIHTCINVKDMEESIEFYCEKLGMQLLARREISENNAEIAFVKPDESEHAIELTHWRDKNNYSEGDQLDHLAFEVVNLSQKINDFRNAGMRIAKEPYQLLGSKSKIAFITDPNGVWIELVEKK